MASSAIQQIYIGLLGRAADKAGLDYWAEQVESGVMTLDQVRANIVGDQPEYAAGMGQMTRPQLVAALYENLFERDPEAAGLDYWVNGGGASVPADQLVLALINGAQAADQLVLDNKTSVADYYTEQAGAGYNEGAAKAAVAEVDGSASAVAEGKAAVDAMVEAGSLTIEFNTGTTGAAGNDALGFDGNGNVTYLPGDQDGVINVGHAEWSGGPTTTTADYTFRLANQLGEGEEYAATFLTPVIEGTGGQTRSQIDLWFADRLAAADSVDTTLSNIQVNSFEFTLNGKVYTVETEALAAARDYDALYDAIVEGIEALKVENPELDVISVERGDSFRVDQYDRDDNRTGEEVVGEAIVLKASQGTLDRDGFRANVTSADQGGVDSYARAFDASSSTPDVIQTNIELDNVGYGSQGAHLNIAGESNSNKGIEQFNVNASNAWLTTLKSRDTSNNGSSDHLKTVNLQGSGYFKVGQQSGSNVVSLTEQLESGLYASLNNGLVDVQDFLGSSFDGDIKLNALLTDALIGRDLNLQDVQADIAGDNPGFNYETGAGNDQLTLVVDMDTAAHEDFTLNIDTGAGNDVIELDLRDTTANQLVNQQALNNIAIDAGSGDDVVRTWGAGDVTILAGAGSDAVYTDNTGDMAEWAFQAQDLVSGDLLGTGASSALLYKAQMVVNFAGIEVTVDVPTNGVFGSAFSLNQALKNAINNDGVLNKLLEANDGPGNTVVIDALIDGAYADGDFSVSLIPATTESLTVSDIEKLKDALRADSNSQVSDADVDAALQAATDALNGIQPAFTTDALGNQNTGSDSLADSNNVVNLNSGNDVLVLGTGTGADVLVLTDYNNDYNTIVNFEVGVDTVDYSSYLNTKQSSSGSVESEAPAVYADYQELTFTATAENSWADLDANSLLAAIKDNGQGFGSLSHGDVSGLLANVTDLVGNTRDHVLRIENASNPGEYKYFHITSTQAQDGNSFTSAEYIGTYDFAGSGAGTGGGTNPNPNPNPGTQVEQSADLGTTNGAPVTFDAGTDDYKFTDDATVENNLVIENFGQGDSIEISNAVSGDYSITNNGADVTLIYNNNGTVNQINLVGVVTSNDLVFDEASFEAAIGFDALTFA